jgi:hypothetical protein
MPRPSIQTRPTRDIAGVASDMLGASQKETLPHKPLEVNTANGFSANDSNKREKTSFALLPSVKRRLTMLKLDLRSNGHKVTEAEIVEALITAATPANVLDAIKDSHS